jgi:hypothetical protein
MCKILLGHFLPNLFDPFLGQTIINRREAHLLGPQLVLLFARVVIL